MDAGLLFRFQLIIILLVLCILRENIVKMQW